MEFKRKLLQRRKAKKAHRRKDKGLVRVKIRGRKRWVKRKSKNGASPA